MKYSIRYFYYGAEQIGGYYLYRIGVGFAAASKPYKI